MSEKPQLKIPFSKGVMPKPPQAGEGLLLFLLPEEIRDNVCGDLSEIFSVDIVPSCGIFRARLWYWRQVICSLRLLFRKNQQEVCMKYLRALLIFVIILITLTVGIHLFAGFLLRGFSHKAQTQFPGTRVEALIAMLECNSCNTRDRNWAIWALGQLDDPRALPVLEKYYVGIKGNNPQNLDQEKLQDEIRHLRHEDTYRYWSVIWRWMLPDEK
jgi:hypothetical protein